MYQYRALPCPNFSVQDMMTIQRFGFLSFPQFLDNGFKTDKGIEWNKAIRKVKAYRPIFMIAHDDEPLRDLDILRKYCANIIFPLHKKEDLEIYGKHFDWIGFPNKAKLRDYDIYWFLDNTTGRKIWWLGVHEFPVNDPSLICFFNGLDSTLPELYAGSYGKIWKGWRDAYKPTNQLHWRIMFDINVQNFQLFLDKLEPRKTLYEYIIASSKQLVK